MVTFGDWPATVPDPLVEAMMRAEDQDSGVHLLPDRFKKGDSVTVLDGPFADVKGIFQAASGSERVIVLLQLLGRANAVKVPRASVARSD